MASRNEIAYAHADPKRQLKRTPRSRLQKRKATLSEIVRLDHDKIRYDYAHMAQAE
ncbi:hypothetical protein KEM52_001628, partial [Ascosphaera acerosa]